MKKNTYSWPQNSNFNVKAETNSLLHCKMKMSCKLDKLSCTYLEFQNVKIAPN